MPLDVRSNGRLDVSRDGVPVDTPLDTEAVVETPEHIVFRHRVAGAGRRAPAYLLDLLLCYAAAALVGVVVLLAAVGAGAFTQAADSFLKAGAGVLLVVLFCVQWVYFALWEGRGGRTPGKMVFGLRVVTVTGRPAGFAQAALRNVLRAADVLPTGYVAGLVAMALTARAQRLGDLVAGTMVVADGARRRAVGPPRLWPPPQPFELAVLPDEVRLDADERAALELFLRRRERLGPARAEELAQMVVERLAQRHGFRIPDATRTLALLYDRAMNAGRAEAPPSSSSLGGPPSAAPWSTRRGPR